MYAVTGTLMTSLATIIFYNKIPLINRVQAKWKKFFFKFMILVIPVQATSIYGSLKSE
jgi:hypothetical protein